MDIYVYEKLYIFFMTLYLFMLSANCGLWSTFKSGTAKRGSPPAVGEL